MNKLRALIVGAGAMGRTWATTLRDNEETDIVAWVDLNPVAAHAGIAALELKDVAVDTDLESAVRDTNPDFVVDVTTPPAHHDITIKSLELGLPVLGEKPMATNLDEARDMIRASENSGKLFMVSQNRRYNGSIRAFREMVNEEIGPVEILNSDFYIGAHFGGFRDEIEHPLIEDMAIHTFDAARFISGSDPVSVYCEEFNPTWSWYRGKCAATAIFEMTGSLRYTYRGSWCSEGRHTSWESEWRAVGRRGTATWDGHDQIVADVVVTPAGFFSEFETKFLEPEQEDFKSTNGSLRDFLNALKTGRTPHGECHDNFKSLAMVFSAIESAEKGIRVPVPQR